MRQCVVRLELRQKRMHRLLIVVEMCSAGLRTAEDAVGEDDPIAERAPPAYTPCCLDPSSSGTNPAGVRLYLQVTSRE
jgi:hypothetical protein